MKKLDPMISFIVLCVFTALLFLIGVTMGDGMPKWYGNLVTGFVCTILGIAVIIIIYSVAKEQYTNFKNRKK